MEIDSILHGYTPCLNAHKMVYSWVSMMCYLRSQLEKETQLSERVKYSPWVLMLCLVARVYNLRKFDCSIYKQCDQLVRKISFSQWGVISLVGVHPQLQVPKRGKVQLNARLIKMVGEVFPGCFHLCVT